MNEGVSLKAGFFCTFTIRPQGLDFSGGQGRGGGVHKNFFGDSDFRDESGVEDLGLSEPERHENSVSARKTLWV